MRTLLPLLLFIPVLSWAKIVTYTYATLSNVVIAGASEHTLVIPPDYPSYTQAYTCTYDEGSYTLDIEVPDDPPPEDEEVEQEDGEGDGEGEDEEDGGVTFATTIEWSLSGSGARFAEGCDPTSSSVTIEFIVGNTEDVVLKVEVTVECTAGNGVGTHDSSTFKIHSPVWDTYHSISMYAESATIEAPRCAAVGEDVTFSVQLPNDSEYDRRQGVDVKTYLDDLKGPNSPRWNRPEALLGEGVVGDSVTWTASDTPTTEPAAVSVVIDDSPYPKPPNERGTTDDDPYPLDEIQITIVAVDSLVPDIGEEIDDGDDDPDTRTYVLAVADTGVVSVNATPNPSVAEADLPAGWSLTGGTGTGKLLRTINRAAPGIYTITCACGTSHMTTKMIIVDCQAISVNVTNTENCFVTFKITPTDISFTGNFLIGNVVNTIKTVQGEFNFEFNQSSIVSDSLITFNYSIGKFQGKSVQNFVTVKYKNIVKRESLYAYIVIEGVGLRIFPWGMNDSYRSYAYDYPNTIGGRDTLFLSTQ